MVRVGEPLGETEPVGCGVVREREEDGRDAGLDGIAGLAEVAAVEDGRGAARAFGFAHDHDLGERDGEVVFGASGIVEGGEGGAVVGVDFAEEPVEPCRVFGLGACEEGHFRGGESGVVEAEFVDGTGEDAGVERACAEG